MTDILIVEDDKELADLLTDFLRDEGYTVTAVESGGRALELFEKYGAKLVVLDINLPDVNGFAVCSKLRENADTPILIVSARTDKEDKLNGLDLGADDYIEKPYDIDILIAKIKGISSAATGMRYCLRTELLLILPTALPQWTVWIQSFPQRSSTCWHFLWKIRARC